MNWCISEAFFCGLKVEEGFTPHEFAPGFPPRVFTDSLSPLYLIFLLFSPENSSFEDCKLELP